MIAKPTAEISDTKQPFVSFSDLPLTIEGNEYADHFVSRVRNILWG